MEESVALSPKLVQLLASEVFAETENLVYKPSQSGSRI